MCSSLTQFVQTIWWTVQIHFVYLAAVVFKYHPNTSNGHGDLELCDIVSIFIILTSQHNDVINNSKDGQMNAVSSFPVTIRGFMIYS